MEGVWFGFDCCILIFGFLDSEKIMIGEDLKGDLFMSNVLLYQRGESLEFHSSLRILSVSWMDGV